MAKLQKILIFGTIFLTFFKNWRSPVPVCGTALNVFSESNRIIGDLINRITH